MKYLHATICEGSWISELASHTPSLRYSPRAVGVKGASWWFLLTFRMALRM